MGGETPPLPKFKGAEIPKLKSLPLAMLMAFDIADDVEVELRARRS